MPAPVTPARTATALLYADWQEGAEYAVLKPMGVVEIPLMNRHPDILVHRKIIFVLAADRPSPIYRQAFYFIDPNSLSADVRGELAVV